MINLNRHIEILLLSNDCVIIPDFGGFMAHHLEASYDSENEIFLPPLRTIGFNSQLKMNDSLLVQSYVEAYDISYPEALSRIEDEVNELKQHLENENEYELTGIGKLSIDENGKYAFEPCEAGLATPEYYGLDSFSFLKINTVKEQKGVVNTFQKENTLPVPENETVKIALQPNEEPEKAKIISIRVSMLRNIAAACIIVVVFFLFSTPLGNSKSTLLTESNIDTGILYKIIPSDIISTTPLKLKENKKIKQTANLSDSSVRIKNKISKIQPTALGNTENDYSIVVASHTTRTNAIAYVNRLKNQGFISARILLNHGTAKVIIGHYPHQQDAQDALNKINDKEEFAGSWIVRIKD